MRLVDFLLLTNGCILDIAKSKLGAPWCTHLSFTSMRLPAPSFIFFHLHLNHGLAALRPLSLFTNPLLYFCLNALHFFLTVSYALRGWWGETGSLSEPSRSPAKRARAHVGTSARSHFKSTALARPYTTFATSNSQTTASTPTLRFQKCIWPIIVKTKACLETSQKYTGQRRGCWEKLSSDVTRFILIITDVLSWVPYSRQSCTYSQS